MMQHPPDKIDAVYKEMQIAGNIVRYGIVAKIYDRCQRAVFMPQPHLHRRFAGSDNPRCRQGLQFIQQKFPLDGCRGHISRTAEFGHFGK